MHHITDLEFGIAKEFAVVLADQQTSQRQQVFLGLRPKPRHQGLGLGFPFRREWLRQRHEVLLADEGEFGLETHDGRFVYENSTTFSAAHTPAERRSWSFFSGGAWGSWCILGTAHIFDVTRIVPCGPTTKPPVPLPPHRAVTAPPAVRRRTQKGPVILRQPLT